MIGGLPSLLLHLLLPSPPLSLQCSKPSPKPPPEPPGPKKHWGPQLPRIGEGVSELIPIKADMSSVLGDASQGPYGSNCIDGRLETLCCTQEERTPWIAFRFPFQVAVKYVYIYNTNYGKEAAERFKNAEVRITNFHNKEVQGVHFLIGKYKGPGRDAEIIKIKTLSNITGSIVYIQTYLDQGDYLNLQEVKLFGGACDLTSWPHHKKICGGCKVLVNAMGRFGSCRSYCDHIGSTCVGAWDDDRDTCMVSKTAACGYTFHRTTDAICQCSPVFPKKKLEAKTGKVSQYKLVSSFTLHSEAKIAVIGAHGGYGCKFVLLDRVNNRTCCYSDHGKSLCDPDIQSKGCRGFHEFAVEELVGQCILTLPRITWYDAGPWLAIFPGKVDDNEYFNVTVASEEKEGPGLEAVDGDVIMFEAVTDFTPCSTGVLGVQGDTTGGCKFQLLHRGRNLSCCSSHPDRGDTLCDPASQSGGCRDSTTSRIKEVPGQCLFFLPNIMASDAGPYRVLFPGKLSDNERFSLSVEGPPHSLWEKCHAVHMRRHKHATYRDYRTSSSEGVCCEECRNLPWCRSFSFRFDPRSTNVGNCLLSDSAASALRDPEDIVQHPSWVVYGLYPSCSS